MHMQAQGRLLTLTLTPTFGSTGVCWCVDDTMFFVVQANTVKKCMLV